MTHDQGEIGFDMPATTTDDSGTEDPLALLPIGSFEQHGPVPSPCHRHVDCNRHRRFDQPTAQRISTPRAGVRMLARALGFPGDGERRCDYVA